MSIIYYPDETTKMKTHVVEQMQRPNILYSTFGSHDLNDGALNVGLWCPRGWEINRVSINFADAAAKDYAISIVRGIGIVSGKNDRLWIKVNTVAAQPIVIPQGFYTGTTMATALATAINAGAFPSASKPFSVSYDPNTGFFTITPSAGSAQLFVRNTTTSVRQVSTAASMLGFTADTAMTSPLVSNLSVQGIGTPFVYRSESSSTSLDVLATTTVAMTMDDQLLIQASSVGSNVTTYEVVYKILDA